MRASNTIFSIHPESNRGFSLVELMIAIVIAFIVGLGAFSAFSVQSKTFSTQREVAKIQQDLRGALYLMEFDLLNACRDPWMSNRYAITDVRYYGFTPGNLDALLAPTPFIPAAAPASLYFASFPVLEFTSLRGDSDGDGIGDTMVRIRYQIYDDDNDGRPDLGRRVNGGAPDLVAQGVVAIGYAFAYNPNPGGDYRTARTTFVAPATQGNVIWAADTDGDNLLDTNLDVNGDGWITAADDISGDFIIDGGDLASAVLNPRVPLDNVVAVRIMILTQSENESPENTIDRKTYVVGNRIMGGDDAAIRFHDRYKRRLQTVTVALRNFRKS